MLLFSPAHYGWRGLSENPRGAAYPEKHPFTSHSVFYREAVREEYYGNVCLKCPILRDLFPTLFDIFCDASVKQSSGSDFGVGVLGRNFERFFTAGRVVSETEYVGKDVFPATLGQNKFTHRILTLTVDLTLDNISLY